ncbi:MAG: hypothetical protein Q8N42_00870 [bacterium]|nr:hypothetical protein [bacterium]
MKKVLIILLVLTLYCNIGWVMGSYYAHHVFSMAEKQLTTFGKVAAGGWNFLAQGDRPQEKNRTESWVIVLFYGIIWPFGLLIAAISWIIYGVYYTGWFVFAGGAAKLLGLV